MTAAILHSISAEAGAVSVVRYLPVSVVQKSPLVRRFSGPERCRPNGVRLTSVWGALGSVPAVARTCIVQFIYNNIATARGGLYFGLCHSKFWPRVLWCRSDGVDHACRTYLVYCSHSATCMTCDCVDITILWTWRAIFVDGKSVCTYARVGSSKVVTGPSYGSQHRRASRY